MTIAQTLILASAAIVFVLGAGHLYLTYFSHKLHPRDRDLAARMQSVALVASAQTSYWRATVGFHVSHSIGALFFGLLYGYLALAQPGFLFHTPFIAALGLLLLLSKLTLARLYWFSTPLRGLALAAACYIGGLVAAAW